MLGLHYKKVQVVPYQAEWPNLFEKEKANLLECLKPHLIGIEHIGSTAIPGMPAKPIIDIMASVEDIELIFDYIVLLEGIGYRYLGIGHIPGRYFLVKGGRLWTTHHLHLTTLQNRFWQKQILFRDYLIHHSQPAVQYAALKHRLASKYANDRDAYSAAKASWINRLIDELQKRGGRFLIDNG